MQIVFREVTSVRGNVLEFELDDGVVLSIRGWHICDGCCDVQLEVEEVCYE